MVDSLIGEMHGFVSGEEESTGGVTGTGVVGAAVATQQQGHSSSYWKSPDVLELVGCVIIGVLCLLPSFFVDPRERPIPFQKIASGEFILNQVINESFDSETFSDVALVGVALILPLGLQLLIGRFMLRRRSKGEARRTICTYLIAFGLTVLTTECIKRYVGFLRPSFYDLCEPTGDFTSCTAGKSEDARRSFPSGHASVAFCGLSLLSLYLEERAFGISTVTAQVVLPCLSASSSSGLMEEGESDDDNINSSGGIVVVRYNTKTPQLYRLYSILCLSPIALAIYVAASRVVDNKHFPADVVGGAVLGAVCARFAHRLWFPAHGITMVSSR
jgi:membrane-associated phospholipid phosphatase